MAHTPPHTKPSSNALLKRAPQIGAGSVAGLIALLAAAAPAAAAPAGYQETLVVSADGKIVSSAATLLAGTTYTAEVVGSYDIGNRRADAECANGDFDPTWQRDRGQLDLLVDGHDVDWRPTASDVFDCNSSGHGYRISFTAPANRKLAFAVDLPTGQIGNGQLKVTITGPAVAKDEPAPAPASAAPRSEPAPEPAKPEPAPEPAKSEPAPAPSGSSPSSAPSSGSAPAQPAKSAPPRNAPAAPPSARPSASAPQAVPPPVPAGRPVEAPISVDPPPADDAAGLISAEELAAAAGHFGTGNSTTPTTVPRQAVELAADLPSSSSEGPSPTSIMIIALGVVAGSILASPVRRALFVSAVPQSSISHRGFGPAGALDVLDIPPPYAAEDRAPKARPEKPARAQRPAKAEKPARAKKPSRARHAATTTARLRRATPVRRPRSASHRPVLTPQAAITVASVWHNPSASSQPCGCSYCSTS